MLLDQRDDALEHLVAGVVSLAVVERLEADDVDVGDYETAGGPAAAIELVAEVREARRPCTRPRQDVDLRESQLAGENLAVCERLLALTGALAAVFGSFLTIVGGERRCFAARVRWFAAILRWR